MKIALILALCIFNVHAKEVLITGHPDYPPVIWQEDGELVGSSVTIVKKALINLGYTPKFISVGTWGRAQEEVKFGRIDILLPPYKTSSREEYYEFPKKPFLMDRTSVFTRKGFELKFNTFKDLKKYEGVAIINDSFGEEFDKAEKKYSLLRRLTKTEQCFQFLLKKRADYVVAGHNAAIAVTAKMGLSDKIEAKDKYIIETGMYTAISKKSKLNTKEFRESFFKEVEKLIQGKFHLKARTDALKAFAN
jgi:polar amino acid transport system substrate-binding protein